MSEPIHVNDDTFEKAVLGSAVPVLVDFWASWCAPCRMIAPVLDKIALEYTGRLLVAKVNTDENTTWASRYRVSGIPTMLFISEGRVVHQQVGALSHASLRHMIDKFLSSEKQAPISVN